MLNYHIGLIHPDTNYKNTHIYIYIIIFIFFHVFLNYNFILGHDLGVEKIV